MELTKKAIVNLPQHTIFNMLLKVELYPEFIPWCSLIEIISKNESFMLAKMTVSFAAIKTSYTSKITWDQNSCFINILAIDGPFKMMRSKWFINEKSSNASEVVFSMNVEFKIGLLGMVFNKMIHTASEKIFAAFIKRIDVAHIDS